MTLSALAAFDTYCMDVGRFSLGNCCSSGLGLACRLCLLTRPGVVASTGSSRLAPGVGSGDAYLVRKRLVRVSLARCKSYVTLVVSYCAAYYAGLWRAVECLVAGVCYCVGGAEWSC